MFRVLLQFAIYIAIISKASTFARKISLEDEDLVIQENGRYATRGRSRYQLSQQIKRDGVILSEERCKPYPEVVLVEPDATSERNTPQFVTVKRCKGACEKSVDTQRCLPSETRQVKVQVVAGRAIYTREVEEHLSCACKCHQLACEAHHIQDEKNCQCVCKHGCGDNENQDAATCVCYPRQGKRREQIIEY